jgi:carbon storage regulator CsrA
MLILTRHEGEEIIIGHNSEVKIVIIRTDRGVVKIGLQANESIPIHRGEIYQKIQESKAKNNGEPGYG